MALSGETPQPETHGFTRVICPQCSFESDSIAGELITCGCGSQHRAMVFMPTPIKSEGRAQVAINDDVTCIHHPSKKAVAVCDGTGDYICSLCAVTVGNQTFSADYLSKHKQTSTLNAHNNTLPRPDRMVTLLIFLGLLTGSCTFGIGILVCFVIAIAQYNKHRKLLKTNPLYWQIITPLRSILLTAIMIIWPLSVISLITLLVIFV